jgi:hypothetical protein
MNRAIPEALQAQKEDAKETRTESKKSNASLSGSYRERHFIVSL